MSETPELGQSFFGNPTGSFGTKTFTDAFVEYLLQEIGRVFWNKNQNEWHQNENPGMEGITFNPYYWGDDEIEAAKPNLSFAHSPQEIRWYKHPGRGQSCTVEMNEAEWVKWFDGAMEIIAKNEPEEIF